MRSPAEHGFCPVAHWTWATSSATPTSTRLCPARSGSHRLPGSPMGQDEGMKLEGVHHITAITGDAQKNVDFYAGVLGLRLVKKTVKFDQPDVYHLYFGDEQGTPG